MALEDNAPLSPIDPCALLTDEEVQRVMDEAPTGHLPTDNPGSAFTVSQCYMQLARNVNSVVVSVTRRTPGPGGRDPRALWKEKIEQRGTKEAADKDRDEEEKEKNRPLDHVEGIGEGAVWMGTSVGGEIYVLKANMLLRIGLGTTTDPAKRRDKAIALAGMALKRL